MPLSTLRDFFNSGYLHATVCDVTHSNRGIYDLEGPIEHWNDTCSGQSARGVQVCWEGTWSLRVTRNRCLTFRIDTAENEICDLH
jgi:hypothetical protein